MFEDLFWECFALSESFQSTCRKAKHIVTVKKKTDAQFASFPPQQLQQNYQKAVAKQKLSKHLCFLGDLRWVARFGLK